MSSIQQFYRLVKHSPHVISVLPARYLEAHVLCLSSKIDLLHDLQDFSDVSPRTVVSEAKILYFPFFALS